MSKKIAFLFPGQGSQAIGMGKDFFTHSEIARQMVIQAGEQSGIDFETLLFEENPQLSQTAYTQPAILLVGAIAHRLFAEATGIIPVLAMGHSLGEFTALVSVGALDVMDAVTLVNLRGKLMAEACETQPVGMLVSLGLEDEVVEAICQAQRDAGKQVWAVNYNAEGQIVIAGIKEDLKVLVEILKEAGARRAMLLDMSVASHCPLLESASAPLAEELEKMLQDSFTASVISNVTARPYRSKAEALELLPQQLIKPVLYKQAMAEIDDEVDAYVEFGHGSVLKGLNRRMTKKPHFNVSDMASLAATIEAITAL